MIPVNRAGSVSGIRGLTWTTHVFAKAVKISVCSYEKGVYLPISL